MYKRNPARLCADCKVCPPRSQAQAYCKACANERDKASAMARRAELKALREEVAFLRYQLKVAREQAAH